MERSKIIIFSAIGAVLLVLLLALAYFLLPPGTVKNSLGNPLGQKPQTQQEAKEENLPPKAVDFSAVNSELYFSGTIPGRWQIEYIPQTRGINIYDPSLPGEKNIDKSQIYISFFKANKFLTLSTVTITHREEMVVQGRQAILYEITKKPGVSSFARQPAWRSQKHMALDVKLDDHVPTYYYSFAYNPTLAKEEFTNFIQSLTFHSYNP